MKCFRCLCLLLPGLLLTGCHRRRVVVLPPVPPPVAMVSVPPVTHPTEPLPRIETEDSPSLVLLLPRRRAVTRFRPLPATHAQLAGLAPATPLPVALGKLTAGGEAGGMRQQTEELLRAQQRRLTALSAAVTTSHIQQVQQTRLFLQQAAEAWEKQDLEGTRTLATKAKVLLDELQA